MILDTQFRRHGSLEDLSLYFGEFIQIIILVRSIRAQLGGYGNRSNQLNRSLPVPWLFERVATSTQLTGFIPFQL